MDDLSCLAEVLSAAEVVGVEHWQGDLQGAEDEGEDLDNERGETPVVDVSDRVRTGDDVDGRVSTGGATGRRG